MAYENTFNQLQKKWRKEMSVTVIANITNESTASVYFTNFECHKDDRVVQCKPQSNIVKSGAWIPWCDDTGNKEYWKKHRIQVHLLDGGEVFWVWQSMENVFYCSENHIEAKVLYPDTGANVPLTITKDRDLKMT